MPKRTKTKNYIKGHWPKNANFKDWRNKNINYYLVKESLISDHFPAIVSNYWHSRSDSSSYPTELEIYPNKMTDPIRLQIEAIEKELKDRVNRDLAILKSDMEKACNIGYREVVVEKEICKDHTLQQQLLETQRKNKELQDVISFQRKDYSEIQTKYQKEIKGYQHEILELNLKNSRLEENADVKIKNLEKQLKKLRQENSKLTGNLQRSPIQKPNKVRATKTVVGKKPPPKSDTSVEVIEID